MKEEQLKRETRCAARKKEHLWPFFHFFAIGKTKKEAFELLLYGMNELINAQKLDYKLSGDTTPEDEWDFK